MARTLLIVDDIRSNREILKSILGDDYTLVEAAHGQEALAIMEQDYKQISAVLLDLGMPVMDGFEVLEHMKKSEALSQLPVIVTTGQTDSDSEVKALQLGANDYVSKPYNSTVIKQRIWNTINLRETAAAINEMQRDHLTGLLNRTAFFEKVEEAVRAKEPGYYILACFDIDNFKVVNDQYGTAAGDKVLKSVARSIKQFTDSVDGSSCRLMADNFAILYPKRLGDSDVMRQLHESLMHPVSIDRQISVKVGRYVVDDPSLSASAMYDRAALAQESIKGRYDQSLAFYDESMRARLLYEQEIVSEMEDALASRQFEVWFQPQYNHLTSALIGAEALVRWRRPDKGLVTPEGFVSVFEQNGFIYELDKFVWEETCRCLKRWSDEGRNPLPVSVNISRYDLFREELVDVICSLVKQYGIATDLLRLEITESAFAESTEQITAMVAQLVDRGFTVEIDDFGSGYSSLNTLKSVPAQIVKLDMRFLEDDEGTQRGGNILESVVRMVKWLDMSVIAEGVETIEQADFLHSIGCNYVQGYLYARPMTADDYEALCAGASKEEQLTVLETVENLENNAFWNPSSLDSLIFNSYVGGACIYEYHAGNIEMIRATEKYIQVIGSTCLTVEEALKLKWTDYIDEETNKRIIADLEKSIASKEEISSEYVFLDLPGCPHETYLRSTMRVIAAAGNRYIAYCTNENITAQRKAEQGERMLVKQLQSVLDSVNCGITAVTIAGDEVNYLLANRRYYEILGYTEDQYVAEIGKDAFSTILEEDRAAVMDASARVRTTFVPEAIEFRIIRRGGKIAWLSGSLSMTSFEEIEAPVQLSVYTDITEQREALERLRMSEEENRLAIEHSNNVVCRFDIAAHSLAVSPNSNSIFELPSTLDNPPEGPIQAGQISPETAGAYRVMYSEILSGKERGAAVFQRKSTEGWRWIEAQYSTIFDNTGKPITAIISYLDVTDRFEKEAIYQKWQQSLQEKDLADYTLYRCNLNSNSLLEFEGGMLLTTEFKQEATSFDERTLEYAESYVYGDDRAAFCSFLNSDTMLASYYKGKRIDTFEYREQPSGEDIRWLRLTVELVEYPNSNDIEAFLLFEDVDDVKRAELATIERAYTDPLTGVLNRLAFAGQVDQIIKASDARDACALLMLDIDGFKQVNDVFGHGTGDQALVEIADSLRSCLSGGDLIGRMGGDEFFIFLKDISGSSAVASKAQQICGLVRKSFSAEVEVSGSIGVAISPRDGRDFETLYQKVDRALYYVKGSGKDNYAFYREDMADEHLELERSGGGDMLGKAGAPSKRRQMLIVDDNNVDHALMANVFDGDFIIDKATSGNAALIRLRHYGSAISVVLLDLVMPGMDGFAVLAKMQESAELRSIPVVVVSGIEDAETSLRVIRCGASDFVTKPIEPDLLRIRVLSAISKNENQRLRAKNSLLEYRNNEVSRYKTVLERKGIGIIELDWTSASFTYDPYLPDLVGGTFDNRELWHILLSDMVADTATVKRLQEFVHDLAQDRESDEGSIEVQLRTPSRTRHRYRVAAYKVINDFGLTDKIYLTLQDIEEEQAK